MSGTYFILATILVIWIGVFLYLVALDRKLNRLGREVSRHEK